MTVEPRPLRGGPLAVDLLNTTWHFEGCVVDWLDVQGAVRKFLAWHDTELAVSADLAQSRTALKQARKLIRCLVEIGGQQAGEPEGARCLLSTQSPETIAEVNDMLSLAAVSFIPSPEGPRLQISSRNPAYILAVKSLVNTIELLDDRPDRIRACDNSCCTAWFLDTSKAGRRRWCSMDRCGNRAKAQRHYDRSRQAEN